MGMFLNNVKPMCMSDPGEMIYDDVEFGEEGGSSSLDNGWSSSEFESYEEASDTENGHGENGLPDAFVRGRAPSKKTHVCIHTASVCLIISLLFFPLLFI